VRISSCVAAFGVSVAMLSGCAGPLTQPAQGVTPLVHPNAHRGSGTLCPANPAGTGVLPDGDFSKTNEVPSKEFSLQQSFAPDWKVSQGSIDFHGTTGWGSNGFSSYCSVDLDGGTPGGITTAPFPTQKGTLYYVTFLLSGNGAKPPGIKLFRIAAGSQSELVGWNIAQHHDVQDDRYETVTWPFIATGSRSTVSFMSFDSSKSSAGAVIANVSVTTAPIQ
jgi:hypothetical protein